MEIEIIGTESLGVRGLCCFIKAKKRRILIDPGVALGYLRHRLLPHPLQVAVGEEIKKTIIDRWKDTTDIVISHFHGDHVPLKDANPYQLNIKKLIGSNPNVRIWTKDPSHLSNIELKRYKDISIMLNNKIISADGKNNDILTFSKPVPHGIKKSSQTVIMTRICDDDLVFVHTSDIQLLNDEAVKKIIEWKADIAFVGGPPLYLSNRLSKYQVRMAWKRAKFLSENVNILILDHHLMRDYNGVKWIKRLSQDGKKVLCGADFMKKPRRLLEAKREKLYEQMPVPDNWHDLYSKGLVTTKKYRS